MWPAILAGHILNHNSLQNVQGPLPSLATARCPQVHTLFARLSRPNCPGPPDSAGHFMLFVWEWRFGNDLHFFLHVVYSLLFLVSTGCPCALLILLLCGWSTRFAKGAKSFTHAICPVMNGLCRSCETIKTHLFLPRNILHSEPPPLGCSPGILLVKFETLCLNPNKIVPVK